MEPACCALFSVPHFWVPALCSRHLTNQHSSLLTLWVPGLILHSAHPSFHPLEQCPQHRYSLSHQQEDSDWTQQLTKVTRNRIFPSRGSHEYSVARTVLWPQQLQGTHPTWQRTKGEQWVLHNTAGNIFHIILKLTCSHPSLARTSDIVAPNQ